MADLAFRLWTKLYSVTIQLEGIQQQFHVILLIV